MSTSVAYIEFLLQKLDDPSVTCKAMFGEYCIYYAWVVVWLVCKEKLFLKICESTSQFSDICEQEPPYPWAKDAYYLPDDFLDDRDTLCVVLSAIAQEMSAKKKKK